MFIVLAGHFVELYRRHRFVGGLFCCEDSVISGSVIVDKTSMKGHCMSHTTCEATEGPRAIELTLAALIDGLRIKNPQLNDLCSHALASMGRNVIEHIRTVSRDRTTKLPHRQRLSAVINSIEHTNATGLPGFKTVTPALIEAIRVNNPKLNRKVVMAMRRFPPTIAYELVDHAFMNFKKPGCCTRLLLAVEQLGFPVTGLQRMPLISLARMPNPEIRVLATKILTQHPPGSQMLGGALS